MTMASIDRYRPPREGYQPPVPPGSRQNRPSHSPARRREIPPAVPTPPQHSARTSPPRLQSCPTQQQSPAQSASAAPVNMAGSSQWSFTSDEVRSTPTVLDGFSPYDEMTNRAKGVNFIYQAGVLLDLPQITLYVAGVYFHRFFMRLSMVPEKGGIHHYNIAATALFLANKVEENCRKTKDIIIAVAKVAQKNTKLIIDEQSKEYWRWRDSILLYEEIMLEQLTFDLIIDNPYAPLRELLKQLNLVQNKPLRQAAWAFCNDACLTVLPLLVEPKDLAIAAIFFASVHTKNPVDDVNGEAWWRYLKGNEDRCVKAVDVIRQFYTENPLRKQVPSLPSPAFDLEVSRRRGDTLLSQPDTLSSNAATPTEADRAISRSPRVNGGGEEDGGTGSSSLLRPDEPNHALKSPMKRKEAELEVNAESDRAEKRARLSEDEEGELVEV